MGNVYLGEDLRTGQLVAVKKISDQMLAVAGARERFAAEREAIFRVSHPNVVRAVDFIQAPGFQALVMEYVEGPKLDSLFHSVRKNWTTLSKILLDIASALEAIHAQGITHRDLKPDNILLSEANTPKIVDFGVAGFGGTNTLTNPGSLVGTAKYIPPEFVEMGESDHRGDIFAWGVIAYELLSGLSPYTSRTLTDLMVERLRRPPLPLSETAPSCPQALAAVVEKAMAIRLVARYQTAGELVAAIKEAQKSFLPAR